MKEINDERRTGSMVVPAWIEACDDEDLKPVLLDPMLALLSPSLLVKWSGKFGQRAKMYPTRTNGYENDKATELFRSV